jgi:hypothetical protein
MRHAVERGGKLTSEWRRQEIQISVVYMYDYIKKRVFRSKVFFFYRSDIVVADAIEMLRNNITIITGMLGPDG